MNDIKDMAKEFKEEVLKEHQLKQQNIITKLLKEKADLQNEIEHLKEMLISLAPLVSDNKVLIVSAEEGLIDRQVELIRERGLSSELTLEDTKKLDLLLKNKNILKDQSKTLKGESTRVNKKNLSNAQLLQIVSQKKPDGNQ